MRRVCALVLATGALAVGAGCGEKQEPARSTPVPVAAETADPLPKLPKSWRPYVDRGAGFAIGLPRGWKAAGSDNGATIRSSDKLVLLSIVPDRSQDGLTVGVDQYAARAARALPGYRDQVEPSQARPFGHNYDGVQVRATATAMATGAKQDLTVIVMRREGLVTFTVVIAADAEPKARASGDLAERVAATLRTRPPSADAQTPTP